MKQTVWVVAAALLAFTACKTGEKTTKNKPDANAVAFDSLAFQQKMDSLLAAMFAAPVEDDKNSKDEAVKQPPVPQVYQASNTRYNDLISTTLSVKPDFATSTLTGQATLLLKPYFYATKNLVLDAKAMDIKEVAIVNKGVRTPLVYTYDGNKIAIELDKEYTRNEQYTVFISYVAQPDKVKQEGSEAITDAKGLYFIDPKETDPNKPTQLWTQGETESSSCWFPTIDSPNEKTTQEISITVDKKYVTLSNGKLVSQKANTDGTRTDTWKQDLPHAPYLFMMAIGEFEIVKDKWRNKEVNYYLEKEYAPYGKQVFGNTPEMLEFFSKKLGVDYPWDKYSQVVVRDFVSGAMENTTATIHGEFVQKTDREMLDDDSESIIAHELFHHWFGDYVTCESWSNLPLNESFANYSEYLWFEYKFGRDRADEHHHENLESYLDEATTKNVDLIRFDYKSREDMFDRHSYDKGGRILHMLRGYVGDDAFFTALGDYLNTNKLTAAEAHQLRLSFEKVTGEDLNWFFNQWFFNKGNPVLEVNHAYQNGNVVVTVSQTQDFAIAPLYKLPTTVRIYYAGGKFTEHKVVVDSVSNTFTFPAIEQPSLVLFDANDHLLAEIKHTKTNDELAYQYTNCPLWYHRYSAVSALSKKTSAQSSTILKAALSDKWQGIRSFAVSKLAKLPTDEQKALRPVVENIAKNDPVASVREAAITSLKNMFDSDATLAPLYRDRLANDKSYSVIGGALDALSSVDVNAALAEAKKLESIKSSELLLAIANLYVANAKPEYYSFIESAYPRITAAQTKYFYVSTIGSFLAKLDDQPTITKGLGFIENIIKTENAWYLRLGGYSALNTLAGKYINKASELEGMPGKEAEIKAAEAMRDDIVARFRALFATEKDPNILKYMGGE